VLLDQADRQRRLAEREVADSLAGGEPLNQTYDPARLAEWTEFHERVDHLPAAEREVFELHYYLGLTQAEVAKLLDLSPRQVSYLWVAATDRLADGMDAPG
jgi:RNA polymerase sigma factor (sigma-70 family)